MLRSDIHIAQAIFLQPIAKVARHQVRQPDDCVHRRADLVAHVGEKSALRNHGSLGSRLGLARRRGALLDDFFEVRAVVTQFCLGLHVPCHRC